MKHAKNKTHRPRATAPPIAGPMMVPRFGPALPVEIMLSASPSVTDTLDSTTISGTALRSEFVAASGLANAVDSACFTDASGVASVAKTVAVIRTEAAVIVMVTAEGGTLAILAISLAIANRSTSPKSATVPAAVKTSFTAFGGGASEGGEDGD